MATKKKGRVKPGRPADGRLKENRSAVKPTTPVVVNKPTPKPTAQRKPMASQPPTKKAGK
jgi:hypothetical protein